MAFTVAWTGPTLTSTGGVGSTNARFQIRAVDQSSSGLYVRVKVTGRLGGYGSVVINAMSIGEQSGSTSTFASTPTQLTFNGGQVSITLTPGQSIWSDWVPYVFTASVSHLIHMTMLDNSNRSVAYTTSYSGSSWQSFGRMVDDSLTLDISSYGYSTGFLIGLVEIDVSTDGTTGDVIQSVTQVVTGGIVIGGVGWSVGENPLSPTVSNYRIMTYTTKRKRVPPTSFGALKIIATKYPVVATIIYNADESNAYTVTVYSSTAVRVPTYMTEYVAVRVSCSSEISAIFLSGTLEEMPI